MKAKPKRMVDERTFRARMHTSHSLAPDIRRADLELCEAGRLLRQASDMLTRTTVPSCLSNNFTAFHKEVLGLMTQARVKLALSKRRTEDHALRFIDGIMKPAKRVG